MKLLDADDVRMLDGLVAWQNRRKFLDRAVNSARSDSDVDGFRTIVETLYKAGVISQNDQSELLKSASFRSEQINASLVYRCRLWLFHRAANSRVIQRYKTFAATRRLRKLGYKV